tara:strand:+ start:347 stop:499 length:153 start_codon:yes stop_codon:yes gene_type:complete
MLTPSSKWWIALQLKPHTASQYLKQVKPETTAQLATSPIQSASSAKEAGA